MISASLAQFEVGLRGRLFVPCVMMHLRKTDRTALFGDGQIQKRWSEEIRFKLCSILGLFSEVPKWRSIWLGSRQIYIFNSLEHVYFVFENEVQGTDSLVGSEAKTAIQIRVSFHIRILSKEYLPTLMLFSLARAILLFFPVLSFLPFTTGGSSLPPIGNRALQSSMLLI